MLLNNRSFYLFFLLFIPGFIISCSTREEHEIKKMIGKTVILDSEFIYVDSASFIAQSPFSTPVKILTTLDYNNCYECMLKPALGIEKLLSKIENGEKTEIIAFVQNVDVPKAQEVLKKFGMSTVLAIDSLDIFTKKNKLEKLLHRNRTFILDKDNMIVFVGNPLIRPALINSFLNTTEKLHKNNGAIR